ncbi:MAG: alanine racemase [Clostridia bacterium]|nr:alanine racemase [Clostridia bacterium]
MKELSHGHRTWATVSLDRLRHNYTAIRAALKPSTKLMAVVKADAYGHGAPVVARELEAMGTDFFAVSSLDEAIQLRKAHIQKDILILGSTPVRDTPKLLEYRITQTVFSEEYAKQLSEAACLEEGTLKVHFKVDTGMTRLGFLYDGGSFCQDTLRAIRDCVSLPGLDAEGIFTHFAMSDDIKSDLTVRQFNRFCDLLLHLEDFGIRFRLRHCCNSAAVINFPEMQLDMVRPGIILFGHYPSRHMLRDLHLLPCMELLTTISQIRTVGRDIGVGYGQTFRTFRNTRIATLPIGYADGFSRLFSNNGEVLIHGKEASIVGRICMDQSTVDVTDIEAHEGDTVTLFGHSNGAEISLERLAERMETIPYEVVCLLGKRVPRIYIQDGKETEMLNYILSL